MVDLDQPFTRHSGYCSQSFTSLVGQISANPDNFHLAHVADFCPMGQNLTGDKKLRDSSVGNSSRPIVATPTVSLEPPCWLN